MKMLLDHQRQQLRANGQYNASRRKEGQAEIDFMPIVKLFTPWAGGTWLLTELDPEDPDIAFGLCDLGLGFPELGTVRLSELEALQGPLGLGIERARTLPSADFARYSISASSLGSTHTPRCAMRLA